MNCDHSSYYVIKKDIWWSNFETQWSQSEQCFDLKGLRTTHDVQNCSNEYSLCSINCKIDLILKNIFILFLFQLL